MVGVVGLFMYSYWTQSVWNAPVSAFILIYCQGGVPQGQAIPRVANAPRCKGFACASCRTVPTLGLYWLCGQCRKAFDTFQGGVVCPHCQTRYPKPSCPECGFANSSSDWSLAASGEAVPVDAANAFAADTD